MSDLGEPFLGNSYPQKLVAGDMERDRRNWKMIASLHPRKLHCDRSAFSVCGSVSDDPLLIP